MKYLLIALLLVFTTESYAQKHRAMVDAATPAGSVFPGFSATYNYSLSRYVSAGAGFQFHRFSPAQRGVELNIPAVFADLHFNIRPAKKNQFFAFLDLGINIYRLSARYKRQNGSTWYTVIPHNNGFYLGTGFGYMRRMTQRGGGPYISLKLVSNSYKIEGYDYTRQREIGLLDTDINPAVSLGFRF